MENQKFPDYVTYDNATQTINFRPNLPQHQGRTSYLSVVLKESNSDYMLNIYYLTLKVSGDPIEKEEPDVVVVKKT